MPATQALTAVQRFLAKTEISECQTYRDAVRLAWKNRIRPNMTKATFAEEIDAYAPHVTQWLHEQTYDKHGNKRADLPAEKIAEVEEVLGNRAISQYLVKKAALTLMEEVIAQRDA